MLSSTARRGVVGRIVLAVTAVSTLVVLTGCSSAGTTNSNDKAVTMLSWDTKATMQPLFDEFKKQTGYTVDASYAPPVASYIQKLQTQLGSNTAPDVFIITSENKAQIMNNQLAKDQSNEAWMSNIAPTAKKTYTKDGKIYGTAVSSWGGGIVYNKALLAKVGFSEHPKTWKEFLDLCTKLKDAGVQPFYEAADGLPQTIDALVGIENDKRDGKLDSEIWSGKTTFAKTWTPALKQYNELYTSGLVPRSMSGSTYDQASKEFEQGKVAMFAGASWGFSAFKQANPDLKLGFFAVPGNSSTYWAGAVSPGYAINAKAHNSTGAEKLIQFLQSKEAMALYQKETGAITTTKNYTPKLDPALDPLVTAVRDGDFYLPQTSWPTNSDVMATTATALVQQMINGKLTPAQVAQQLDSKLASLK